MTRMTPLSGDPLTREYDLNGLPCGCTLDSTGYDLPDFTLCSLHAAAPEMAEALRDAAGALKAAADVLFYYKCEVTRDHVCLNLHDVNAILDRLDRKEG